MSLLVNLLQRMTRTVQLYERFSSSKQEPESQDPPEDTQDARTARRGRRNVRSAICKARRCITGNVIIVI